MFSVATILGSQQEKEKQNCIVVGKLFCNISCIVGEDIVELQIDSQTSIVLYMRPRYNDQDATPSRLALRPACPQGQHSVVCLDSFVVQKRTSRLCVNNEEVLMFSSSGIRSCWDMGSGKAVLDEMEVAVCLKDEFGVFSSTSHSWVGSRKWK
ncbi:hypothetical protein Tco_0353200 [Tanacetum coccineum]